MDVLRNLPLLRFLILVGGLGLAVVVGLKMGEGSFLVPFAVVLLTMSVVLLNFPRLLFAAAIILLASKLTFFGVPDKLNLHYVAMLAVAGCLVPYLMTMRGQVYFNAIHGVAIALSLLLAFIMWHRGFGIMALGSGDIGGMAYFYIFSAVVFIFAANVFVIEEKWWPWIMGTAGLMSVLPFLGDLLLYNGTSTTIVQGIVQTSQQTRNTVAFLDHNPNVAVIDRFFSGNHSSIWLMLGVFCVFKPKQLFSTKAAIIVPILLLAFAIACASGFRLALFRLVLTGGLIFLLARAITPGRVFAVCSVALLGIVGLYLFASDMPLPVQRAVSFLPAIEINPGAQKDAISTIDWRFVVWRQAVQHIPDYLVIGKGFSYGMSEYLYDRLDAVSWALISSSYHNGPLSMLILTGVPGTLLILLLFGVALRRHFRLYRQNWMMSKMKNMHTVFFAYFIGIILTFLLLYGDLGPSLPHILFVAGMLEAFFATEMRQRELSLSRIEEAKLVETEEEEPSGALPSPA